MNKTKPCPQKGFTLIELLVVVAIISLLSSIVFATLTDARNKAKDKAFRQQIQQFITALELYKLNNNRYPGESYLPNVPINYVRYTYTGSPNSTTTSPSAFNLKNELNSYLSVLPDPVYDTSQFSFRINGTNSFSAKCFGDTEKPIYLITVSVTEKAVEDWKFAENPDSTQSTILKCFSIK